MAFHKLHKAPHYPVWNKMLHLAGAVLCNLFFECKDLDKELEMSDDQETEVSELYFAHFDKVEAKMESSQRPSRTEMESLDSNLEKEVKALLSEDQQELYTAWLKKQEKQRSSQRLQGGQRPPR